MGFGLDSEELKEYIGCTLAYGHFSTIHPGHIRYLRHAKSIGPRLVVAVVGDASNRYVFNQSERSDSLNLLGIADSIILLSGDEENSDLCAFIKCLKPSNFVLGSEHENNYYLNNAIRLADDLGCKIRFHAGEIHYATADLLNLSERELQSSRKKQFLQACNRNSLDFASLSNTLNSFSSANLIVLGDTIVDQYAACEAIGLSAEAPVVVVRELQSRNFIGGAAVVAAHIAALKANCCLISVVGNDSPSEFVRQSLLEQGIDNALIVDSSRPTTFKKRYMVENQKLFRVSKLEEKAVDTNLEDQLIQKLIEYAPDSHGIVVSDFIYGVITPKVLNVVRKLALKHDLMLFGDLQCSSQVGSITKFKNFNLLCPNEREARLALQDKSSGLELISQSLIDTTMSDRLIMKLGGEGFIAYDRDDKGEILSQAFPALSANPVDVAGAGDSLLAVMAAGLASGQKMLPTAALACCMSSLAVETMGNSPISVGMLDDRIKELFSSVI